MFDYHPYDDNLCPCPEAGLAFQYGDILAIGKKNKFLKFREIDFTKNSFFSFKVNQDDPNWWQARLAEENPENPAMLVPSRELEEKRKAYVR